jgi:hypothetical protein
MHQILFVIGGVDLWTGCSLIDQVMYFWLICRDKLIHDYSLVGYILSPHPTIMADAISHKLPAHDEAADRLIIKLILDQNLVGEERTFARAQLIDTFLTMGISLTREICLPEITHGLWPRIRKLWPIVGIRVFIASNKGIRGACMPSADQDFGNRNGRKKLDAGKDGEVWTMVKHYHLQDNKASFGIRSMATG